MEYRDAYEPYLMMKREDVPIFDQRFVGRYGNKLVHRLEVAASGYDCLFCFSYIIKNMYLL